MKYIHLDLSIPKPCFRALNDLACFLNAAKRYKKALNQKMVENGVLEKIAAVSSRTHGDARKAVELLSKSAHIAEQEGTVITMDLVDRALEEIERDKYVAMIKSSPKQLQAALYSIISLASGFH